jgi:hypothetical protein
VTTTSQDGQTYAQLADAMQHMAGVCDYANSEDGQGFNGPDAWLGHQLADLPLGQWDDDTALAAWDMLRKYRGQLLGWGIEYDELPVPPGAEALLDERRAERLEAARENAKWTARAHRDAQAIKARSSIRCSGEGEEIVLAFPYNAGMVAESRNIPGRQYNGADKTNSFPFTSLPEVVAFADKHGIPVQTELRAMVAIAAEAAAIEAAEAATRPHVTLDAKGLRVETPFDPALNEALRVYNGGWSTWKKDDGAHRPKPKHPTELLALFAKFQLRVSPEAEARITGELDRRARNRVMATAISCDPIDIPGLAPGAALKPVQYPVVAFAREHRRVIVGDEMGFGKTLSSLAAVAADGAYPAVVVCRPSLTLNWANEIARFFPGLSVFEASGTTASPVPPGTDIVIIGSAALGSVLRPPTITTADIAKAKGPASLETVSAKRAGKAIDYLVRHPECGSLQKIANRTGLSLKTASRLAEGDPQGMVQRATELKLVQFAKACHLKEELSLWLKELLALNAKALIIDEGQDTKSQGANRTQAVARIAEPIVKADGLVLNLSGTSVLNRAKELLAQLETLDRLAAFGGAGAYLMKHCFSGETRHGKEFKASINLRDLNTTLLEEGIMIRRSDPALLGLPDCTESVISLDSADLDQKVMTEYWKAEQDTINYLADRARKIARKKGLDPRSAAVKAAMKAEAAEHLVRINTLRQLIGQAKLPAAANLVEKLNGEGEKVVVAAHHRIVVDAMAARFGGLRIQGDQSVASKEGDKAAFQTAPLADAPAISVAIEAGGVGHTLTAARYGVQVETPWTPGAKNQMKKRMHRIGQRRPVTYIVLLAEDTVDDEMWGLVTQKESVLDAILDGRFDTGTDADEKSLVSELAWSLAQRGL